ncbi:MAG: hypothetical protein RBQ91_07630 [Acholeplasma sp.]|nr:hypothetical protein [Acholeplasma sp.]
MKTVVVERIKNVHQRALKIEEVIHEQKKEGFDFVSVVGTAKQETILVFEENPGHKLNNEINKGISDVKGKLNKIVDSIKK